MHHYYILHDNHNQRRTSYPTWESAMADLERLYRQARHLQLKVRPHLADGWISYADGSAFAEVAYN